MTSKMSRQSWHELDFFYSGDLIVGFCDEDANCYISMQEAGRGESNHKWIWARYTRGTLVPSEEFDNLLMAAMRRCLIDEISLTRVFSVRAPNKLWNESRFDKHAAEKAMRSLSRLMNGPEKIDMTKATLHRSRSERDPTQSDLDEYQRTPSSRFLLNEYM